MVKQLETLAAIDVGTNSFHHQALGRVADGLTVTARSEDGVVEAVEMPGRRFCLGVQWHPEEMTTQREDMLQLFRDFAAAARAQHPASERVADSVPISVAASVAV